MKLCIVDPLGLNYDGSTLSKRGLGGSESAVILMSKELAKIGFDVTVFNDCISDDAKPGVYDGVTFAPLSDIETNNSFDILIAMRSVAPFVGHELAKQFKSFLPMPNFEAAINNAKFKVLWMHDTFCDGDDLIEELALHGRISEIFTLSDFHTSYVTNAEHGKKRMFEVLKPYVFQTRNGITKYIDWVDVSKKDRNLFVYNASVTKGMIPLVEKIWPEVKKHLPDAKLKVIGGYYRFREDHGPDEQELKHQELTNLSKNLDIEFTGIIKQSEIAEILASAGFMIYPAAFPETFGISSLESLAYNTPIITCQFGALSETAIDVACYKIPYPIEPNGLFPFINSNEQVNQFVKAVVSAFNDPYLYQQKAYACNQVKDISGWDTVALQWKQHFYNKLGAFLPVDEYRKVSDINFRVQKIFGRRFADLGAVQEPRREQQKIEVIVPAFNAEQYINTCIQSLLSQDYDNYHLYIIDDCSTDQTLKYLQAYKNHPKITVISNNENCGAVFNQVNTVRNFCDDDSIIMLVDGDDWLINDPNIFHKFNNIYHKGAEFTYGSCWSLSDRIPLIAQPYPPDVKDSKDYRSHKFNWNMPYTHLRTFRKSLINNISDENFLDDAGLWVKAGGDTALFYSLIEEADSDKVICIPDITYVYNDANPLNDYKVNGEEQTKTANMIIEKTNRKKKVLIAIPTARYIEPETFKSIFDLTIPEDVEIDFQYFYGYNVDQVRNLIADWVVNGPYDYLFSVDHDVSFTPDTLVKLLNHNVDVVSGIYRQRIEDQQVLEIYGRDLKNLPWDNIADKGLIQIGACGFGCVLVKKQVFVDIGYPQFEYHSAIKHADTISEDIDFCRKASSKGFKIWADTTIVCGHTGEKVFRVNRAPQQDAKLLRLKELESQRLLPQAHLDYLCQMRDQGISPQIIYDIGSCVMHWTNEAKNVWPDAEFILFEAMDAVEPIYKKAGNRYHLGVLADEDDKIVTFYENTTHPGGNSYYKENIEINPEANEYFNESHAKHVAAMTLDSVVKQNNYPLPDLIKMDVQGAELDIVKGAEFALSKCQHLILELQNVEYNKGAPLKDEVIKYLFSIGFALVSNGPFSNNGVDGDYHFMRIQ